MSKRRQGRRRHNRRHRKIKRGRGIIDGEDKISSMPDDILHRILSFVPTELAMKTCVLSSRWRYVWCESPTLDINEFRRKAIGIDQTLASYTAPKIMTFNLCTSPAHHNSPQIDSLIEFAISRDVQKLSLTIVRGKTYDFPDFFYINPSVEQLSVILGCFDMIPKCTVSWVSLRHLSLSYCNVPDESMGNILHGSPILESLTLYSCGLLQRLDLSQSPSLTRLDVDRQRQPSGPFEIVAPHIHYLRLMNSDGKTTTLVDVSSLTQANLDISIGEICLADANILQTAVLENLAKSHNAEKLTLGSTFLQLLSLAEIRGGVSFPTLKVQTLTVTTEFCQSVVPGIARLLQNSPRLKKLTIHTMMNRRYAMDKDLDSYSDSQGLNQDQCWRSKYEVFPTLQKIRSMSGCCNDETSKLLASSIKLVLSYAKTLETMVVCLAGIYFNDAQWSEEQLQMAGTLSHNNNVSVLLNRSNVNYWHRCFI